MRIGIDARFYGTLGKGLGRYTEKLIEHLEQIDRDHDYIIFLRRENYFEYQPKNPRFQKRIAQYAWYGFAEQTLFVCQLYRCRLDLVHFPHFNVPLLYRKTFIVTIHDLILIHYPTVRNTTRLALLYRCKYWMYRIVIASAIRRAWHIIAVSRFTLDDITAHYPESQGKISVTYESADAYCQYLVPSDEWRCMRRFGLLLNESSGLVMVNHDIIRPYFLYVGNAYPHKNLSILIALARAFPDILVVLVGKEDYFYARLHNEVIASGIGNMVFAGFVSDRELSSLYRFARLYIFPSLYEGFGLPPLEAMGRGVPVVSSDRGSLPEILGQAATYFDPASADALIASVRVLHENTILRNEMRARGYAQVARYSFREMASQTHALYRQALQNKYV